MPSFQLDPTEFSPIVELAVEAAFQRLRQEHQVADNIGRILLNKREAAGALGVSVSTLDRLRREGGLPSVKIDGRVLFRPEALREWAAENERDDTCTNDSIV